MGPIMQKFLSDYATPLTTGLFVVSLVSGVALFFHFQTGLFHGMHEWLSMVLILPFVFHIWKNWRPFVSYFKRAPMMFGLVLSIAAGIAFAVPAMGNASGGRPPQRALFEAVENGTVAQVAPLFGLTGEALAEALKADGYAVASVDEKLGAVADASGKTGFDIVNAVVKAAAK